MKRKLKTAAVAVAGVWLLSFILMTFAVAVGLVSLETYLRPAMYFLLSIPFVALIVVGLWLLAEFLPEPQKNLEECLIDEFKRQKLSEPPPSLWTTMCDLTPDPNARTLARAVAVYWGAIRRHTGPFGAVAYDLMPIGRTIEKVFSTLGDSPATREYQKNIALTAKRGDAPVLPTKYPGTAEQIAQTYLHHTPFYPLFDSLVPYGFSLENRFEHTMLIASSGHGKTTLIENMVLDDARNGHAVVVIDPKDERNPEDNLFMRLSRRSELRNKLILIDPDDEPGINLFDIFPKPEPDDVKGFNAIYESYSYFFNDLLGAELTAQMGDILQPLISLACVVDDANMYTLIEALENAPRLRPYLDRIPPIQRQFLEREVYPNKEYIRTRGLLRRRVYGFGSGGPFGRMFMAQFNKMRLQDWLQDGMVVLVHASPLKLGSYYSLFGRYFATETARAAQGRIGKRPAFLYVDEAQDFFDATSARIIKQMRSSRLGALFATQIYGDVPMIVRNSLIASSIRLFGGVGKEDAALVQRSFNSSVEELTSCREGQFICWAKGQKVRLNVPRLPPADMSDSDYEEFRRHNRMTLGSAPAYEPPDDSAPPPPPTKNSPRGGSDDVPLE